MSEKKLQCTVVKDLLPNYIEGLTTPETNEMLEEHLASCAPCNGTYNYMRAKTELKEEAIRKDNQGKRFFKKARVRRLTITFIALVMALILACGALYVLKLHRDVPLEKIHLEAIYELPDEKVICAFRIDGMHAGQVWTDWSRSGGIEDLGEMWPGFCINARESYQFRYSWWEMLTGDRNRGDLYYLIIDLNDMRNEVFDSYLWPVQERLTRDDQNAETYERIKRMMNLEVKLGRGYGPTVWYPGRADVVQVTSPDEAEELLRKATVALGGTWTEELDEMPIEPLATVTPMPYQTISPYDKNERVMVSSTPDPALGPRATASPIAKTESTPVPTQMAP